MKSKVLWGMFGLLLTFALILTGCGDGGGGDDDGNGGGSFSISGVPVYTATAGGDRTYNIGAQYSGPALELTGKSIGPNNSTISIGNIGSISADGKLTLNLPANPPENDLVDATEWLGISAKLLVLETDPHVFLSKGGQGGVTLIYADRNTPPGNNNFPALKQGWQYMTGDGTALISDPLANGYKWVIYQGN